MDLENGGVDEPSLEKLTLDDNGESRNDSAGRESASSAASFPKIDTPGPSPQSAVNLDTAQDPIERLDQTLGYFQDSDDTSKLVGLGILRSIVYNKRELREDIKVIDRCWAAISTRFLDRLLRASDYKGESVVDRDYLLGLAVATIYNFAFLLPEASRDDEKFAGRINGLLAALKISPIETKNQILHILLTLAGTHCGSASLLKADNWPVLPNMAVDHESAFKVIGYTYEVAVSEARYHGLPLPRLDETISNVVAVSSRAADTTMLFRCVMKLAQYSLPDPANPPSWLDAVAEMLLKSTTVQCYSSHDNRHAMVLLTACLVQVYPDEFPQRLFSANMKDNSGATPIPLSWRFIRSRLIDINTWIFPLAKTPGGPKYEANADRVFQSYRILSAFIEYLAQPSGAAENEEGDLRASPFAADVLKLIRKDLSQCCSMTIKALSERFDVVRASTTNIDVSTGLPHPSSPGVERMREDRLAGIQVYMLALWLREKDTHGLREEAGGIVNLLLVIYCQEVKTDPQTLFLLEALLVHKENIDLFLHNKGWEILIDKVRQIFDSPSASEQLLPPGLQMTNILGSVAFHLIDSKAESDHWMDFVKIARTLEADGSRELIKYKMAVASLAILLVLDLPPPRYKIDIVKELMKVAKKLLEAGGAVDEAIRQRLNVALKGLQKINRNRAKYTVLSLPQPT